MHFLMHFWGKKNGIRESREKSAGFGILVKKEQECGFRTPLPDPAAGIVSAIKRSFQAVNIPEASFEKKTGWICR